MHFDSSINFTLVKFCFKLGLIVKTSVMRLVYKYLNDQMNDAWI